MKNKMNKFLLISVQLIKLIIIFCAAWIVFGFFYFFFVVRSFTIIHIEKNDSLRITYNFYDIKHFNYPEQNFSRIYGSAIIENLAKKKATFNIENKIFLFNGKKGIVIYPYKKLIKIPAKEDYFINIMNWQIKQKVEKNDLKKLKIKHKQEGL